MMSSDAFHALRYTLEEDLGRHETFRSWVRKECPDGYLVIQHDADKEVNRTHWHALLRSSKTKDALRTSLQRALPGLDKTMYSFREKECTDDVTYERYLCHSSGLGVPVKIIMSLGDKYSQQWADEQNAEFWRMQKDFIAKAKAKKKDESANINAKVLAIMKSMPIEEQTSEEIAYQLITAYDEADRDIYLNVITAKTYSILIKLKDEDAKRQLARKCAPDF